MVATRVLPGQRHLSVPKCVAEARTALGLTDLKPNLGKNMDKGQLLDVVKKLKCENLISPKTANLIGSTMRQKMGEAAREKYKAIKSDEERKQWIAAFLIDPAFCTNEGFNECSVFSEKTQVDDEVWLTQSQLQGPEWLNDAHHAKILIDSSSLEERPHEWAVLAEANVKQYKFFKSVLRRATGEREASGVRSTSELSAAEATEVKTGLELAGSNIAGTPMKKQRTKPAQKPKVEKTPEQMERENAIQV